jgi:hypothetical protein
MTIEVALWILDILLVLGFGIYFEKDLRKDFKLIAALSGIVSCATLILDVVINIKTVNIVKVFEDAFWRFLAGFLFGLFAAFITTIIKKIKKMSKK